MATTLPTTAPMAASILMPSAPAGGPDGSWSRLVLRGALAAVVVGVLSVSASVLPAAAADTCPNATVRVQTGSTALPDCRAYEMVSAPYKEGFVIEPAGFGATEDGIVSYQSFGSFAGNPQPIVPYAYHATRSGAGWTTTALAPPGLLYDTRDTVVAESAGLQTSLWAMSRRELPGDTHGFYLRDLDGALTRIGDAEDDAFGARSPVGWSDDLSHIVFNHGRQGAGYSDLFEYVGTGNGSVARAVSVDNDGQQTAAASCLNDVSADGRVIVYTSGCLGGVTQVWARVAGSATVAVSGSECTRSSGDPGGVCNGVSAATYEGAAVDGSRAFLTTSRQLVNADINTGNDLYACDIPAGEPAPVGTANPCASLTQISGTAPDAQVQSVVAVSEDGSRVYFVAQGVLADNLGVGDVGPATAGDAHNLYMWERNGAHPAGETRFIARLAADDVTEGKMTPDGRYLLFVTASQLVGDGPGKDTDNARDAYRYDTATKAVVRISTAVSGSGGDAGFDVSLAQKASMTADGSTVIFDTGEALSGSDTDGVTDVYSWHDGQVSLISAGGGNAMGIAPSGGDIFFLSDAQVLPGDGDANTDLYDARIGGGFAPAPSSPCSGDQCQGQPSQPPSLADPPAAVLRGLSTVAPPSAFSLKVGSEAQRNRLAATGKVSLTVTTNAPGMISATATATIGGRRSATAGSARRLITAPGNVSVTLSLSKGARSQLARRGRLSVKVAVSHSKVALDREVTLRLARTKKAPKRSDRASSTHRPLAGTGGGPS